MSLEHIASAILTAHCCCGWLDSCAAAHLRALIRTSLLTAALAEGALLLAASGHGHHRRPHPWSPPAVIALTTKGNLT